MTHTLQLTFLGLCLFHLGNPVGEPAQDLVDSATVYLINALDVDLGTPRESCSGDAELYRHEPMLTIDPEEWAVVGESPETALEPVIDLSETRVTILNDMPTQWVEAPRSDLQFGSVPDGTEGAGPPHELQWIAPLERILGEESLELRPECYNPLDDNPCFTTEVELQGGLLTSSNIAQGSDGPLPWEFVSDPGHSPEWRQAMTDTVTLTFSQAPDVRLLLERADGQRQTLVSLRPFVQASIENRYVDSVPPSETFLTHFRWFYEVLKDRPSRSSCLAPYDDRSTPTLVMRTGVNAFCPPASWGG